MLSSAALKIAYLLLRGWMGEGGRGEGGGCPREPLGILPPAPFFLLPLPRDVVRVRSGGPGTLDLVREIRAR